MPTSRTWIRWRTRWRPCWARQRTRRGHVSGNGGRDCRGGPRRAAGRRERRRRRGGSERQRGRRRVGRGSHRLGRSSAGCRIARRDALNRCTPCRDRAFYRRRAWLSERSSRRDRVTGGQTTVDGESLAVDVRRLVRREKQDGVGDLLGDAVSLAVESAGSTLGRRGRLSRPRSRHRRTHSGLSWPILAAVPRERA